MSGGVGGAGVVDGQEVGHGRDITTLDGPVLLMVRSGSGEALLFWTRVWMVAEVVKFCADLVPVT